jgi:hypothetical protein
MENPAPAYLPPEDTDLFRVQEPGWYAFDDDHRPVLGPFSSRGKVRGSDQGSGVTAPSRDFLDDARG